MQRSPRYAASPASVYLAIELAKGFLFMTSLMLAGLYRIQAAGLGPFELMVVAAVCEATVLLFEVPTGVVADTVSRRTSVIIGFFVVGLGFIVEGSHPTFTAVLIGQFLWGLGSTFISGADVAWIADEVGADQAGRLYTRGAQLTMLGGAAGVVASVGLGSISLGTPTVVGGVLLCAVGASLYLVMPETGFQPPPRAERAQMLRSMQDILKSGLGAVRLRPTLGVIFVIAGFLGMANEGFDRLWEYQLLSSFTFPKVGGLGLVVWFGAINAVGLLLGVIGTGVLHRRIDPSNQAALARTLATCNFLMLSFLFCFGLAGQLLLALVAYWLIALVRGMTTPVYTTWLNQELEGRTRATVNSLSSQCNALGQIVGGPVIGRVASHSIRIAMVVSGMLHLPVTLLLLWMLRRTRPAEEVG